MLSVKVSKCNVCLTLGGEAKLWYKSLRPINLVWNGFQNQFQQQYSKIGNTREQLFHAWRSFHFDKNTETLDSKFTHIRLWQTSGTGSFQKHTINKIVLGALSHRRQG